MNILQIHDAMSTYKATYTLKPPFLNMILIDQSTNNINEICALLSMTGRTQITSKRIPRSERAIRATQFDTSQGAIDLTITQFKQNHNCP